MAWEDTQTHQYPQCPALVCDWIVAAAVCVAASYTLMFFSITSVLMSSSMVSCTVWLLHCQCIALLLAVMSCLLCISTARMLHSALDRLLYSSIVCTSTALHVPRQRLLGPAGVQCMPGRPSEASDPVLMNSIMSNGLYVDPDPNSHHLAAENLITALEGSGLHQQTDVPSYEQHMPQVQHHNLQLQSHMSRGTSQSSDAAQYTHLPCVGSSERRSRGSGEESVGNDYVVQPEESMDDILRFFLKVFVAFIPTQTKAVKCALCRRLHCSRDKVIVVGMNVSKYCALNTSSCILKFANMMDAEYELLPPCAVLVALGICCVYSLSLVQDA